MQKLDGKVVNAETILLTLLRGRLGKAVGRRVLMCLLFLGWRAEEERH